jgi:phosphoribosylformimino-5-aminoimidazole carboxamide ribotide isomerase
VELFPAIDLRQGCVVRLSQGEAQRATVYETDPAAVAERFADAGARWIHVVDLDRAFGEGDNNAAIARIVAAVGTRLHVQVGGGFRSLERIEEGIAQGATRVVIGTAAVRDPDLVRRAAERVGAARLAVGIDARDGLVAVRGWRETGTERADELTTRVVGQGIETVIYTDIGRDGMLAGADIAGSVKLQQLGASVIASGGVATLADVRAIRDAGLAGAIVGRALYERRFTVVEAVRVAAGHD